MMSDAKTYELMLLFTPEMAETAILKEITLINKRISEEGAVLWEDFWGKRPLAYPIKKMENGYYQVLRFSFPPARLAELDQELRLTPSVLRFLITVPPKGMETLSYEQIRTSETSFSTEKKASKRQQKRPQRRVESMPNTLPGRRSAPKMEEKKESLEKDSDN